MGCGGSKDHLNTQESTTVAKNSTTTAVTNQKFHHDKLQLDDANFKTSIDSPSPIELENDVQTDNKTAGNHAIVFPGSGDKQSSPKTKKAGQKNESCGAVTSAWTPTQQNTKKQHVVSENDIDEESEFGKDGIDFCSESFDGIRKKSSGKRTDLSEIPSDIINPSLPDVSPRLTKKQSEEPFDPRALIDVDKFKAANAAKDVRMDTNDNNTITMETRVNIAQSVGQPAGVLSPPNYQDFYDDDEKELMASIEQDFISTALPGVVM